MEPQIQQVLERLADVDDEQLQVFLDDVLNPRLEAAAEEKDVESARTLADAMEQVRAELRNRAELARQREEEIAAIMSRVHAQQEEGGEQDGEGDGEDNGEGDGKRATTTAEDNGEEDGNGDEGNGDGGKASSRADRPLPRIADLARAKKVSSPGAVSRLSQGSPDRRSGTTRVVAASDVPGIMAGTEITDAKMLRTAFKERYLASSGSRTSGRIPVARIEMNYPEERVLRGGDFDGNDEKLRALLSPVALTASGGICAPPAGFYDTNTLATGVRPVRDSLPVFGAERGGIRFIRSSSLIDAGAAAAIGVITEAEDAAGGAGATKPCLTIDCESVVETLVQAISRCLQFGNFNARTHPEYITHLTDITIAAHARVAEQELWESMCDASTAVTAAENLGAWRDLYGIVGRAVAMFRSRHRMSPDATLRMIAPFWLADMLSIDLVRQMPGDGTISGTSRQTFAQWLGSLNVRVSWSMEGGTDAPTQIFGDQGVGPLDGWPDSVEFLLFPEGAFLFLDGGTLDLGVVRDSTLNQTNDFQLFAETFEAVAFLGPESLCVTADLCPSGLSSGQDDTPNCPASGAAS